MTTQEFIKKMTNDEALSKKMSECKAPEEAYEVAKEAGLTDDIESFKAVMTAVNKQLKGELSDDELDNVAGGMSDTAFGLCIVATDIAAIGAMAAATAMAVS
ncbi:MAG: Nif11-like leader peptide family RiPP precursor [Oscillospiraceae bacterium]